MQESLNTHEDLVVTDDPDGADLTSLKLRDIWAFFKSQDSLFWLINMYFLLEYVRPQALYPALDFLPYNFIVIFITLFLFFARKEVKLVKNVENKLFIVFIVIVLLSSLFAFSTEMAFRNMPIFILWVLIYFFIINIVNTENRFFFVILMFLIYNFKMSQHALRGWAAIGFGFGKEGTGGGPGWFLNSGEFGIEMSVFLSLATYFIIALRDRCPRWKLLGLMLFPLTAITGMISSSSRGAIIGGLAVVVWMLIKSRKKILAAVVILLVCAVANLMLPQEQVDRFNKAGEDKTSINRTDRWRKGLVMAEMYPVLGVGYSNWSLADVNLFSGDGALCHNVFVECVSELGYSGLFVYCLMIFYTFVNNHRTRKLLRQNIEENKFTYYMAHGLDGALIGYMASGFFVTVLYYPYFWINLSLTVALNNIVQLQQTK